MNGLNLDRNSAVILGVILVVVVIGSFLLSRGGAEDDPGAAPALNEADRDSIDDPVEAAGVELGRVVIAENIDRDSCPVDSTSTLDSDLERFYVVATDTTFPQGSDFFVRLYHEGNALEDSPQVSAEDTYEDICIYAVFEAAEVEFEPGDYEAEFIINGNPSETVDFSIR